MENTNNTCINCGAVETLYELNGELLCRDCLEERGYVICRDCGAIVSEADSYEVDRNEHICQACYEQGYETCEDCDRVFPRDEACFIEGHGAVCEDCLQDGYTWCEHCESYVPNDSIREVRTGRTYSWARRDWNTADVCIDCLERSSRYWLCDDCGQWYSDDVSYTYVEGVGNVCDECLESERYHDCEACGDILTMDSLTWDEDADSWLCQSCYDEQHRQRDTHRIHEYSYKPTPKPRTRRKCQCSACNEVADLLFGIELEVDKGPYDKRESTASAIADASTDVYMKRDGSLESGFEIVTHPCTLEYHMYEFKWRHITSLCKKAGFKSHDARTCGLHVHVGRYQLGESRFDQEQVIAKVLMLVDRHWDALVKFSRRKEEQLHWAVRPQITRIASGDTEEQAIRKALSADNGNRYQAVNLNNSGTIEFRLFNGTLHRDTIIATLQLVSNVCLYAKEHTVAECLASKWSDITSHKTYNELDEYCMTRELVDIASPAPITLAAPAQQEPLREDMPSNIVVGTTVGLREAGGSTVPERFIGMVRTVAETLAYPYGVSFPGWHGGHDLGGILTGDSRDSGWWFNANQLEVLA